MDKNNKSKKPRMKIVWLVIGVVIFIAIIGSTNNSGSPATKVNDATVVDNSSTSKPEQTTFKVGDVISFDEKKVTVISIERNWSTGNEYTMPQNGNEYIKVQVTIENDSSSEVSYNMLDWKLQDSKGVIKDSSSISYSVDGALDSGDLAPRGKVSGFLIFEVPVGDAGLVLQYEPSFWSDKKLKINL